MSKWGYVKNSSQHVCIVSLNFLHAHYEFLLVELYCWKFLLFLVAKACSYPLLHECLLNLELKFSVGNSWGRLLLCLSPFIYGILFQILIVLNDIDGMLWEIIGSSCLVWFMWPRALGVIVLSLRILMYIICGLSSPKTRDHAKIFPNITH